MLGKRLVPDRAVQHVNLAFTIDVLREIDREPGDPVSPSQAFIEVQLGTRLSRIDTAYSNLVE